MSCSPSRGAVERYMPQLDGVRAGAVGLVFVEHFGGRALNAFVPLSAGSMGVNLFFVLSGFLITSILLNTFEREDVTGSSTRRMMNFYARRLIRLVPVLYVTIGVTALLGLDGMGETWGWHASYMTNVHMALGHREHVFWSLAVEEQFYLLWPLALLLVRRGGLTQLVIGLILSGLMFKVIWARLGLDLAHGSALLPANLEVLGIGALLAIVSFDRRAYVFTWYEGRAGRIFDRLAIACFGAALAIWIVLPIETPLRYYFNDLLTAVGFAWIVLRAAIGFEGPAGRVLGHPAALYVGRISYGLYVIHSFVPDALTLPEVTIITGELPRGAVNALAIVVTFGLATLSWYVLERPLRRLSRSLKEGRAAARPERGTSS